MNNDQVEFYLKFIYKRDEEPTQGQMEIGFS